MVQIEMLKVYLSASNISDISLQNKIQNKMQKKKKSETHLTSGLPSESNIIHTISYKKWYCDKIKLDHR